LVLHLQRTAEDNLVIVISYNAGPWGHSLLAVNYVGAVHRDHWDVA